MLFMPMRHGTEGRATLAQTAQVQRKKNPISCLEDCSIYGAVATHYRFHALTSLTSQAVEPTGFCASQPDTHPS